MATTKNSIVCKICGKNVSKIGPLSSHLSFAHGIKLLDYIKKYEGFVPPKCPICNNDCKHAGGMNFRKTCGSVLCNRKLHEKTNIEKYGVPNPSKAKEIKDKKAKTTMKHYGVDNPFKSSDIKKKISKTNISRYGVDNPGKSEVIKEKIKNKFLEKYGVTAPFASEDIKKRIKETNIRLYGVDNPAKAEIFKEASRKTCMNRYGVPHSASFKGIIEKRKKTCLKKYNSEQFFGSKQRRSAVLNNSLASCLDRYSDEFCNIHIDETVRKIVWVCKKCGSTQVLNDSISYERKFKNNVPVCKNCLPVERRYSVKEKQVVDFLKSIYSGVLLENDRTVLRPKELDIYLPELNVAFEFEGELYHGFGTCSSQRTRDIDKWKIQECKNLE